MKTATIVAGALTVAVALTAEPVASAVQGEEFALVVGVDYEGAIVPASSPWHGIHRTGLPAGTTTSGSWTPLPTDATAAEASFVALLASTAIRQPPHLTTDIRDKDGVAWLQHNAQTLKRYYFGVQIGGGRHVMVHAVAASRLRITWRSEVITGTDGGCDNLWFDFDLDGRRIVWIRCAGTA